MAIRQIDWYVVATRGGNGVRLPSPEGEEVAHRMAETMIRHGWDAEVQGPRPASIVAEVITGIHVPWNHIPEDSLMGPIFDEDE